MALKMTSRPFNRICLALGLLLAVAGPPATAQRGGVAVLLDVKGPIGPATSDFIGRGLKQAREEGARFVILRMDTPGGLDTSMRAIIKDILASPIPIVTYVPQGGRAASAGTYILYASHVAAMAPGANLGAATPIQIGGGGSPIPMPGGDKSGKKEDEKKPGHPELADKVISDAAAYIRSLAQLRGRNVEWAQKAVREAASLSASEALREHVIDLVADDIDALLKALDGRTVTVPSGKVTFDTAGITVRTEEPDWRYEVLAIITNPNVAYILMLIGIYGIIFEFYSPGLIFPGVIGAICLLLALYAFQVLPVNYAGLALIFLGAGLMLAEVFVTGFGVLGLGGVAALVIGSVLLLDTGIPGYGISPWLIGGIAAVSGAFLLLIVTMLLGSRRRAIVSGPEEMVGLQGSVVAWDGLEGRVRVHGEVWNAKARETLEPGTRVRVVQLDGLTIVVAPDTPERSEKDAMAPL